MRAYPVQRHGLAAGIRRMARGLAELVGAYRELPNMMEFPDGSVWLRINDGHGLPATRLRLPVDNHFLGSEEGRGARSDVAMQLMDEDVHGFVAFLLARGPDGQTEVRFRAQTRGSWVEAFTVSFAAVMDTLEEVKRA